MSKDELMQDPQYFIFIICLNIDFFFIKNVILCICRSRFIFARLSSNLCKSFQTPIAFLSFFTLRLRLCLLCYCNIILRNLCNHKDLWLQFSFLCNINHRWFLSGYLFWLKLHLLKSRNRRYKIQRLSIVY